MLIRAVKLLKEEQGKIQYQYKAYYWKCSTCGATLKEPVQEEIELNRQNYIVDVWGNNCQHTTTYLTMQEPTIEELIEACNRFEAPTNLNLKAFNPENSQYEEIVKKLRQKQLMKMYVSKVKDELEE